ncbi:hypothetical protein V2J09_015267 [Rumex salicifolius]
MLFAGTLVEQIQVILCIFGTFCEASGQKISVSKSEIFISKNVTADLRDRLHLASGFVVSRDCGKYLGMPILNKHLGKEDCGPLIDKSAAKMGGWKSNCLSFASRVTLTRVVLSSLPVYSMSTALLPSSICDKVDRICRKFLWGGRDGQRKMHKVACPKIILPKQLGDLGIKSMAELNLAMLGKIS